MNAGQCFNFKIHKTFHLFRGKVTDLCLAKINVIYFALRHLVFYGDHLVFRNLETLRRPAIELFRIITNSLLPLFPYSLNHFPDRFLYLGNILFRLFNRLF